MPDLKHGLRQLADEAARRTRPLPVADVITEGDRRQRQAITLRRREHARAPGRRRPGWVPPVAAAAAVIAVIAVVAIVSGAIHGRGPAGDRKAATVYVGYTVFRPLRPHEHLHLAGTMVPISTATNTPGKPIPISGGVGNIAFTPDGKTIYVTTNDFQQGAVIPISTATNTPGSPIRISGGAGPIAITADGKAAYVGGADKIVPINTATNARGKPIRIYGSPSDIEFTPDGKTAYVVPNSPPRRIVSITTATSRPGKPILVCRGRPGTNPRLDFPRWSAITPDGKTVYVGCTDNTVTPISTATNTPGRPIPVSGGAVTITFTPDGKTAYVGGSGTVTPISTATNTAGKPIRVGIPVVEVTAITPDGKTLYVTNYEGRPVDTIVPISTATNTPGPPIRVGNPVDALAITPDGKTLYAAIQNFAATHSTVTVVPISTATNRAGKPIYVGRYVGRARFVDGDRIAITP